jgi:hypothetical protein
MSDAKKTEAPAVGSPVDRGVGPPASWLVRALVTLAKRELADANATCGDCWPAGQEWHELGHTSQHAFMHRAREAAGIPHAEYRALIEAVMSTDEAEALDALWTELERPSVGAKAPT